MQQGFCRKDTVSFCTDANVVTGLGVDCFLCTCANRYIQHNHSWPLQCMEQQPMLWSNTLPDYKANHYGTHLQCIAHLAAKVTGMDVLYP